MENAQVVETTHPQQSAIPFHQLSSWSKIAANVHNLRLLFPLRSPAFTTTVSIGSSVRGHFSRRHSSLVCFRLRINPVAGFIPLAFNIQSPSLPQCVLRK